MWEWWRWGQEKGAYNHQYRQTLLILRNDDDDHHHRPSATIKSAAMILTSWPRSRCRRCLFLALCSPLLLPFLCATFPLLCAIEICLRLCRRRRTNRLKTATPDDCLDPGGEGLRRCEEGDGDAGDEMVLLQRYLEDQLFLVVGSVYDCGDELDDEEDDLEFPGTALPLNSI